MTRPPRRPEAPALRQSILATSAALFAERGYDRASMRVIAQRVGVTAPGLYYHFPNKQALLYACLETALEDLVACGEAALEGVGSDPRDRLRAFARAHVAFQIDRIDFQAVFETALYGMGQLVNALTPEQRRRLGELQRRHLDTLRRILKEGVDVGRFSVPDLTPTAFAIFAIGEHTVSWFRPSGPRTRDEIAALYGELALRMVGVVAAGPGAPPATEAP